ncbi:MAG: 30S ribosomal protein S12 methylthiotransferase RimO [Propionicimonas sp.]|uniref:30S ribosomal protein S12 methylthiotransferase RimO n=1 Tax=Propionicimonas sp. TaxID=1955623 RepID=UPI003D0A6D7C
MSPTPVHLVSLGCARNEVDSEELAGRLAAGGFTLVDDPDEAAAIVVNTCGFIDAAKKDSIDTLLDASDRKGNGTTKAVVAVGCLAERYGRELADSLPEADAVLGFDSYPRIAEKLEWILAGGHAEAHVPRDRRTLLPVAPVARPARAAEVTIPGHGWIPRYRLARGASAPLKIASGCDRRCAFCAIPTFRGSYLSRPVDEILAEARWLVGQGVREVVLVSENSSAYGKDTGTNLERLLVGLDAVEGLDWIRVSYLQPAEVRPTLLEAMLGLPRVVPYFDLPFQHASGPVLRRMRRFGDADSFLDLLGRIRAVRPAAGVRSNVITGFPGETDADVDVLASFLSEARLDAVGVFGYSDEEGTEGATLPAKVHPEVIDERVDRLATLVDEVSAQRAADRIGERVQVLVEAVGQGHASGRSVHQGPESDGGTTLEGVDNDLVTGALVWGRVTATDGVDLVVKVEGQ